VGGSGFEFRWRQHILLFSKTSRWTMGAHPASCPFREYSGPGVALTSHIHLSPRFVSSSSIGTTTLSWVSACSTAAEHSQQEGFTECRCQRHVKTQTWRRTRDLERSTFRHKRHPASEATLAKSAAEGGTMGEKWPRNFAESGDFHVTFGFFYVP
jgi:hypothetical protein